MKIKKEKSMLEVKKGILDAKGKRFALVVSRFNEFVTQKLLDGAMDCLIRHQAEEDNQVVIWVPGAFELPYAASRLASSKKYDAILCLGAVIRGETPHYDYIANQVTRGIAEITLSTGIPVILGVLITDTLEQAIERAGTKGGNKGWVSALSAIEMVDLLEKI